MSLKHRLVDNLHMLHAVCLERQSSQSSNGNSAYHRFICVGSKIDAPESLIRCIQRTYIKLVTQQWKKKLKKKRTVTSITEKLCSIEKNSLISSLQNSRASIIPVFFLTKIIILTKKANILRRRKMRLRKMAIEENAARERESGCTQHTQQRRIFFQGRCIPTRGNCQPIRVRRPFANEAHSPKYRLIIQSGKECL